MVTVCRYYFRFPINFPQTRFSCQAGERRALTWDPAAAVSGTVPVCVVRSASRGPGRAPLACCRPPVRHLGALGAHGRFVTGRVGPRQVPRLGVSSAERKYAGGGLRGNTAEEALIDTCVWPRVSQAGMRRDRPRGG